ncbi:MAG: hypothetical protein Q4A78_07205 [Peptostreptococcaceae bacterium]|nr:hypothetical protein [Peptostreptococcaceae bacterium]
MSWETWFLRILFVLAVPSPLLFIVVMDLDFDLRNPGWAHFILLGIYICILSVIERLFDRELNLKMEKEMKEKGMIVRSPLIRGYFLRSRRESCVAVINPSGRIEALMIRGAGLENFRHLMQYIGLTIEEARALTAKETASNIFWPPVRGEAIWKALDEAEKKLRELREEQERIRRLGSLHMEEPADSLWEEEEQ